MTGEHLPLAGVRVVDLTRLLPGGFCTLLLADLGADVIKVEDTGAGDYLRYTPPFYKEGPQGANSAPYLALNRNKRALRLDLRKDRGKEVFLRLIAGADVLVESFRPGTLARLGLPYETLQERNRGLIYCALTGYGQDGPLRARAGHDINYLAGVGLLALTGERDGPPILPAAQIADLGGGALLAVIGILAALRERDGGPGRPGSGAGQLVDVAMADGALSWLALVASAYLCDGQPRRRGDLELAGAYICYRPYRCADGYVALGALEGKFWQAFCEAVARPDLIPHQFDPPGSPAHAELEALFASRTREQWAALGAAVDCCLTPVLELEEALESEQVRAKGLVVEQEQPGLARPARVVGFPLRLSRTQPGVPRRPAPAPGEQGAALLAELGYSAAEVERLRGEGVI